MIDEDQLGSIERENEQAAERRMYEEQLSDEDHD